MTRTNEGPFSALQDMYLYDPITGEVRPQAHPKLVALAERERRTKTILNKLKRMPKPFVLDAPEWPQCNHIVYEDDGDFTRAMALDMLASYLEHHEKSPIEMAMQQDNKQITLWVRTG